MKEQEIIEEILKTEKPLKAPTSDILNCTNFKVVTFDSSFGEILPSRTILENQSI